ncbi:MAG: cytochrome c oxidase subunit II [Bacteroidetes bacterium]|nr:cytochrome c oxidase subunit II [Bacteroidota bacterium]
MSDGASNFVESVNGVFLFSIIMSVFFLVLITVMMIYFVIRYSRKRNPRAVNVHSNMMLEVTWTIIPTILVLILFWYGWVGYKEMADIPEDAMTIEVTAQMWKWQFKYDDGRITDSLYVPVAQPVVLDLISNDVNHAFFISDFRVKKDIFPGLERRVWFIPNYVGEYDIFCAEYCGMNHSYMLTKIFVMTQEDFDNWKKAGSNEEPATSNDKRVNSTEEMINEK